MTDRPPTYPDVTVYLGGCDGNVFMLISRVCRHLRRVHGQVDADAFAAAAMPLSYEDAVALAYRTVNVEVDDD